MKISIQKMCILISVSLGCPAMEAPTTPCAGTVPLLAQQSPQIELSQSTLPAGAEEIPGSPLSPAGIANAAAVNVAAAPIAQQVNPQPNFRRQACIIGGVFAFLSAILVPTIYFDMRKSSQYSWPYSCADDGQKMEDECFVAKIEHCGSCSGTQYSHVRCPIQNITTAKGLTSKIKQELEDTCGDNARYCVARADCHDDYYVCDTDKLAGFIQATETSCQPKTKVPKLKNFFHRKRMAWDKRRTKF